MKAIVHDRYGPPEVLQLRDVDRPAVGDDEVLVRVHAASVHPDVWHTVRGLPYVLRLMGNGVRRPRHRVPGTDMAGRVEAVGRSVMRFRPGDEVFGETMRGYQWRNGGAFAEYVSVPEELKQDAMNVLSEMIEAGSLTPVVDRTFPLSEVPEAIRYLESGRAAGMIVVTVP